MRYAMGVPPSAQNERSVMRPLLLLAALALPAYAEDRALLIGVETYEAAGSVPGAEAALAAEGPLTAAGFTVIVGADLKSPGLRARLSRLANQTVEDGRVVILLSGHFASDTGQTYFLGAEADQPDIISIGAVGLPLNAVLQVAARSPGGAVVLLGTEDRRLPLGPGLTPGIGALVVPQGVTVIRGDAADIADFTANALIRTGASLPDLLTDTDFQAEGFLAPLIPFRPGIASLSPRPPTENPDDALWQVTQQLDSLEAFQAYVKRFPGGKHAVEAQLQITTILTEPQRDARVAEDALTLSRDDRRAIQRGLGLLGFDPKGIDGVFGAGSRTAISRWQKRYGHAQTTYLTRDQIAQLSAQAERRAAELEAEAAIRRAEQEKLDRQYWAETGKAGDEPGLRSYLKRYPDGVFADLAAERLAVIDKAKRDRAAAQDRNAWDLARDENTMVSYRRYLKDFPKGAFAEQAQQRLGKLVEPTVDPAIAQAKNAEAALDLSDTAKRLIELRLTNLDFNPGEPDGKFNEATRRALRRFQSSRDMAVTGYVDQATMISLLAGR
jgi:peptidoglycan hydrolase-like protein with peptidoglycan-binding domain